MRLGLGLGLDRRRGGGGGSVAPSASLAITWTDNSGQETGHRIETSQDGVEWVSARTVAANVEEATITGLEFNTEYFIRVIPFNGVGDLPPAETLQVYTAPSAPPSALVAEVTGPSTVDLTWTLPATEPASGGYKVYRSENGGGFTAIAKVANGVSSYGVTSLTDDTGYAFKVVAFNDNGTQPDSETSATNTVSVTTDVETTAPLLTSITVDTTGLIWTMTTDEPVTFGAGGNGGFTVHAQGAAITLSYTSGSGTTALVYTANRAATIAEVLTLDYTQPGNGIQDTSGNGNDMATFAGTVVTNSSTVAPAASFEWDMETTAANVFTGDGVATLTGAVLSTDQAHSGTKSLKSTTGFHVADFDISPNPQDWSATEGTVEMYVYFAAAGGVARIFHLEMSGGVHNIRVAINTTNNEGQLVYSGGTTVSTTVITGFTAATWHKVTAKWRTVGTPTLSLQRNALTPGTSSTALPTLSGTPKFTRLGSYQAGLTTSLYLDDIKIYKAWLP